MVAGRLVLLGRDGSSGLGLTGVLGVLVSGFFLRTLTAVRLGVGTRGLALGA